MECLRERREAEEQLELARSAGFPNAEHNKEALEAKVKECTYRFMCYDQGVMDAFLANKKTAFIPIHFYPFYLTHRSAVPQSTRWRCERTATTHQGALDLENEYKELGDWTRERFEASFYSVQHHLASRLGGTLNTLDKTPDDFVHQIVSRNPGGAALSDTYLRDIQVDSIEQNKCYYDLHAENMVPVEHGALAIDGHCKALARSQVGGERSSIDAIVSGMLLDNGCIKIQAATENGGTHDVSWRDACAGEGKRLASEPGDGLKRYRIVVLDKPLTEGGAVMKDLRMVAEAPSAGENVYVCSRRIVHVEGPDICDSAVADLRSYDVVIIDPGEHDAVCFLCLVACINFSCLLITILIRGNSAVFLLSAQRMCTTQRTATDQT